jgi:hypothetical protein
MDRDKEAFFITMKRINKESKDRRASDPEHRKRWMLKSMSGGFGRNQSTRPKTVTLPKVSILEDKK